MPKQHPFEPLVEGFSESLVKLVESIPEEDMPFGAVELTGDEQLDHYLSIRDDTNAWLELIQQQAGADYPMIPRDVIDYVVEMERRITKQARSA